MVPTHQITLKLVQQYINENWNETENISMDPMQEKKRNIFNHQKKKQFVDNFIIQFLNLNYLNKTLLFKT